jgi:hypothetical protein
MSEQHDEKSVAPRAPRRPPRAAAAEHAPYKPPAYEPKHQAALQALAQGLATMHQQRIALDWIINAACALYEEPYRPGGEDGARDTVFALGRAFPARQIVKLLNIKTRGGIDGQQ